MPDENVNLQRLGEERERRRREAEQKEEEERKQQEAQRNQARGGADEESQGLLGGIFRVREDERPIQNR